MQSLVGQSIGRFEIIEEIGRGGMGIVYRARQTALGRQVAIKVLPPQLAAREGNSVERFFREARAAAKLTHPNIVTIHDVGQQDDFYYIVMEEVKGRPLHVMLRESGRLSVKQAAAILTQVASALDYAHSQGVIHRDVKPANILVRDDGTAKLVDFGIARVAQEPGLTATGFSFGTAAYVAPEQIEGAEASAVSDIYSLGVVLYEMLTGQPPFRGATPTSVLYKHVHEPPPTLRSLAPDLPAKLEPIIKKALAKDPVDRYPTASALAAALTPIAERDRTTLWPPAARSTPLPTNAPRSTPVPGVPPRATPIPGAPPRSTPIPSSAPRATPAPSAQSGGASLPPPTQLVTPKPSAPLPVQTAAAQPQKKRTGLWIAGAALLLAVLVGVAFLLFNRNQSDSQTASTLVGEPTALASANLSGATTEVADLLPTDVASPTSVPAVQPTATNVPPTDAPTATPSPTPPPTDSPTLAPSPTLPVDLVRPADGARVSATVIFECKPVKGAAAYQFETRTDRADARDWRSSPRLTKCLWNVAPAKDKYFAPGPYEWRALAVDAAGGVLSTSAIRTFQILVPTATPTRPPATRTPVPTATQPAAQQPTPPPAANTPPPNEPPTRTPEPLPEPPTRTPEPLP